MPDEQEYWSPQQETALANLIDHLNHWHNKLSVFIEDGKTLEASNAKQTIACIELELNRVANTA
tara:strand:- start:6570 stop:6761 length:192 start_codon:yes stop_codon:yes gene_type:complete